MPADTRAVRDWLKQVGALSIGAMDDREFEARLRVLTPALARQFAEAAFCYDSAVAVAAECPNGFPTFGEVVKALRSWWREQRDPFGLPMLGTEAPVTTEADRQSVVDAEIAASWASMSAWDVKAKIRTLDGHPFRDQLGGILAIACRKHAPQHLALLPTEWLRKGDSIANDNDTRGGPAA